MNWCDGIKTLKIWPVKSTSQPLSAWSWYHGFTSIYLLQIFIALQYLLILDPAKPQHLSHLLLLLADSLLVSGVNKQVTSKRGAAGKLHRNCESVGVWRLFVLQCVLIIFSFWQQFDVKFHCFCTGRPVFSYLVKINYTKFYKECDFLLLEKLLKVLWNISWDILEQDTPMAIK